MKAIVTGANGTLGQVLSKHLEAHTWQVVPCDSSAYPVGDWDACSSFLESEQPQAIFHLASAVESTGEENETWLVNVEWTRCLAAQAASLNAIFVLTSSTTVWPDDASHPFAPQKENDTTDGYGSKIHQAELAAVEANPDAVVTRLGWQIGHELGGRDLLDHIEKQIAEHGKLSASNQWYPACSFLEDTAAALLRLAAMPGDVYLLDSNEHWSFYQIALALREKLEKDWLVEPTDEPIFEQRMLDPRSQMPSLFERLPSLSES